MFGVLCVFDEVAHLRGPWSVMLLQVLKESETDGRASQPASGDPHNN